jgi:D-3-phosphoglycerate dehydrogenase
MDLKQCKVLVTATSYARNDPTLKTDLEARVGQVAYNPLGKPLTSAQLADLLPGVDGLIAGLDAIDSAALAKADRLKVVARYGVGLDNVDLEYCRAHGITVTNTPGANSASVAEMAACLILALARGLPQAMQALQAGEWPRLSGVALEGKTVGLIGLGAIGKLLATRMKAFGCRVIACDPFVSNEEALRIGVELKSQDDVIAASDFLSLHLPLNEQTRGLVNGVFLGKMKKGAFLMNTARGELIEEKALLAALQSDRLAGAALDVFSPEPPEKDNPLLRHNKVIVTPHISSQTDGATNAMGRMALEECLRVLRGERPKFPIR